MEQLKADGDNAFGNKKRSTGESSYQSTRSKWQETLARERQEAAERKKQQEDARAKRLARLFSS